jgi:hypothetical protein
MPWSGFIQAPCSACCASDERIMADVVVCTLDLRPRIRTYLVIFVCHERRGACFPRPLCGTLVYAVYRRLR